VGGDEVIVPSLVYASAEAIPPQAPAVMDIDPDTLCVTPEYRAAASRATKAAIAVHLFGKVAGLGDQERTELPVLEDAAQARARPGQTSSGERSATSRRFSFYPRRTSRLATAGRSTTSKRRARGHCRTLRFHGSRDKVTYEQVGYNSRLDDCRRRYLRVAATALDAWARHRSAAGDWYAAELADSAVALAKATYGSLPAWQPVTWSATERADELLRTCTHRASNVAATTESRIDAQAGHGGLPPRFPLLWTDFGPPANTSRSR